MCAIDGYVGQPVTHAALKLSPLVFLRPGELRYAEWREIDVGNAEWRIRESQGSAPRAIWSFIPQPYANQSRPHRSEHRASSAKVRAQVARGIGNCREGSPPVMTVGW
jgi:hypothetical protein